MNPNRNRARLDLLPLAIFAVMLGAAPACSGDSFSNVDAPSQQDQDAGNPEASVINGGCDATLLPTQNACVIDAGLAVFVSKSLGSDDNMGSRLRPLATLQKAIDLAASTHRRVYACAETYAESIVLADGVSLFGYFDCAKDWAVDATKHATVEAPASPALKGTALGTPMRVDSFELIAPDAKAPSESSIAVMLSAVKDITFANGRVLAKRGADGANGVEGVALKNDAILTMTGGDSQPASLCTGNESLCRATHLGAAGGTNTCVGASGFSGGPGGAGGFGGKYTTVAGQLTNTLEIFEAGAGGTALTAAGGVAGNPGTAGNPGDPGAVGASSKGGVLTTAGFAPGDGTAGKNGAPGQGGGGGTGDAAAASEYGSTSGTWFGHGGAGGGAGGCPGLAGTPGKGGGASIAIHSIDSGLHLQGMKVESGAGGNGGSGTFGSSPVVGAPSGANLSPAHAGLKGGLGGRGGWSGWSGHGAGGPSIGIAFKGAAPDAAGLTPTTGAGGKGKASVTSGASGLLKTIDISADGVSVPTAPIP